MMIVKNDKKPEQGVTVTFDLEEVKLLATMMGRVGEAETVQEADFMIDMQWAGQVVEDFEYMEEEHGE